MYLPVPTDYSGSLVGNSYLSLWIKCPRKWYYSYLYPMEGGEGLIPEETRRPLLQGSLFHTGMEHWLRAGIKDGEDLGTYDLDPGIAAMEKESMDRQDHWADDGLRTQDLADAVHMLTQYDGYFGPKGYAPQWPEIKVVCDEKGMPLIEREFTIPLGVRDYVYTCRVDAVVTHHGYLCPMEHKTSAPGMWVENRLKTAHYDSQFDGELFVVRSQYPGHKFSGALINVAIKGWEYNKKNKYLQPAQRDLVNRTDYQLKRFKWRAIRTLEEIDAAVDTYRELVLAGSWSPEHLEVLFPSNGLHTGACWEYRSECDFHAPCWSGDTTGSLRGYKVRASADKLAAQAGVES